MRFDRPAERCVIGYCILFQIYNDNTDNDCCLVRTAKSALIVAYQATDTVLKENISTPV